MKLIQSIFSLTEDQFLFIVKPLVFFIILFMVYKSSKTLTKTTAQYDTHKGYTPYNKLIVYSISIIGSLALAAIISQKIDLDFARWCVSIGVVSIIGVVRGYETINYQNIRK